jgi:SAM-dependent methyltransferase
LYKLRLRASKTRSSATLDLDRQNLFRRRYAATHPGWRESGQVYEATVRQYVHPAARVLDVGCGRGGVIELLHSQVASAVGVDPDRRSLVEHRAPAVRRAAGLLEHLPFSGESFDLVACSWVLEHLARPERAFAEVARVLQSSNPAAAKRGGHLVFLTPNALHPLTWANCLLGRLGDAQGRLVSHLYGRAEADTFPVVYRANTRRRITQLAKAAGLEPVAFYAVGDPTYLAFNKPLYRLALLAERLTPRWMKVHLVGDFAKAGRE